MGKIARLKANQKCKKVAAQKQKVHTNFLRQMDMYDGYNFVKDIPPNPSYSLMYSLKDGMTYVAVSSDTH